MAPDEHQKRRPRLFISHASSDGEFANAVRQELDKVFANGIEVFCTSSPGAIAAGADWLAEIESKLAAAQAVIPIVTPVSIERPWLWFEVGASWQSGREGTCRIYPLCAPEIELSSLPSPLDRLQALSMGRVQDLKILFQALIEQFGFGKISSFRAANITRRIPKYKDVTVKQIDLNERALYSGRYFGYSTEELMEVIDDQLFRPASDPVSQLSSFENEQHLFKGKLIHFRDIDRRLELPPGTAKKLLGSVAGRYGLVATMETDHLVRYQISDEDDS